jgi:Family of unknown function (DUF6328)
LEFRRQHKEQILRMANRLAIAGLGCLAVAMTGAIMLITDLLLREHDNNHRDGLRWG